MNRIKEHTSKHQVIDVKEYGLTVIKSQDQIGLIASAIEKDGPADKAGLKQGSRIYEIIGYGRVNSPLEFEGQAEKTRALVLRVIQDGRIKKIQIIRRDQ